jgi:hypothetical protein
MVALNFKKQFAGAVESGAKTQTVRAIRKGKGQNPVRGGKLQLYTGMRTSACRKLGDAVCTDLSPITVDRDGIFLGGRDLRRGHDAHIFAAADGFKSIDDFIAFIAGAHGLPFTGQVIFWRLEKPSANGGKRI